MSNLIHAEYRQGYKAAERGDSKGLNPYGTSQTDKKYAWLGGYNDYLAGHELDLNVFKEDK